MNDSSRVENETISTKTQALPSKNHLKSPFSLFPRQTRKNQLFFLEQFVYFDNCIYCLLSCAQATRSRRFLRPNRTFEKDFWPRPNFRCYRSTFRGLCVRHCGENISGKFRDENFSFWDERFSRHFIIQKHLFTIHSVSLTSSSALDRSHLENESSRDRIESNWKIFACMRSSSCISEKCLNEVTTL